MSNGQRELTHLSHVQMNLAFYSAFYNNKKAEKPNSLKPLTIHLLLVNLVSIRKQNFVCLSVHIRQLVKAVLTTTQVDCCFIDELT